MTNHLIQHIMKYNVVCKTDPYNASKHGFKNGKKLIDTFNTLTEANAKILDIAKDCAETYFANWGNACLYASQSHSINNIDAGTSSDGSRWVREDIYTYEVEAVDWYEVNDTESGYWVLYEGESLNEAIRAVKEFYEDGGETSKDMYKNGERIWCFKTDTIAKLDELN